MKRKLIYVCSPYSGNIEYNTLIAKILSRYVVCQGYIPITPHIYFTQFMNDNIQEHRDLAFEMNFDLMDLCDQMWVFIELGQDISTGMQREIDRANEIGLKIHYFNLSDARKEFSFSDTKL